MSEEIQKLERVYTSHFLKMMYKLCREYRENPTKIEILKELKEICEEYLQIAEQLELTNFVKNTERISIDAEQLEEDMK
jgi:superfamily I DNA/RNA helicase